MKLPHNREQNKKNTMTEMAIWLIPLFGIAFLLWYIKNAACDVVYSDYIRLVNSYLPDVCNPKKFFVADVLTRIPINYLARIINVKLFGFSITFDRVLGVVSVGLAAWCFSAYSRQLKVSLTWFMALMVVMFSLNKWEMLTNGSGWSHFFAFACFYYHQILFDRYYRGQEGKWDKIKLILLPWFIILGTAGPYCAIYAVVMILASATAALLDSPRRKTYITFLFCTLAPFLLYILSNSFAVEEHAGATGRSLGQILADHPTFPVRFILKSLAGMFIGGEELQRWIQNGCISNKIVYLLGIILMAGYLWSLWLNISLGIYKKTLFPLMLLVSGGANHLLIFLSRYIFEKEDYALSSRYALQFQVGILGILLTFALASQIRRKQSGTGSRINKLLPVVETAFCIAILLGNGYTTYREIQKAPYREENFEKMAVMAPSIPSMTEKELKEHSKEIDNLYEYRKGTEKIQEAFRILEENHLNIFRNK